MVRFVNGILLNAIRQGASDIHFELYEGIYRVRVRIDGLLRIAAQPPAQAWRRRSAHGSRFLLALISPSGARHRTDVYGCDYRNGARWTCA